MSTCTKYVLGPGANDSLYFCIIEDHDIIGLAFGQEDNGQY